MKVILKISILLFVVLFFIVCKKEQSGEFVLEKNKISKQKQLKILKSNNLSINLFKSEFFSNIVSENIVLSNSMKDKILNFEIKSKYQEKEFEMPFYFSPSNSDFVKMISSNYYFKFYSDRRIKTVIIPLNNPNYSMQVIIPKDNKSLSDVINNLNSYSLNKIYSKMKKNKMQVILPKFQIKHTQKSKTINFKLETNTKMKHSYFSDEDENSYKTLFINQAFVFIISETKSNSIIFIGKINRP